MSNNINNSEPIDKLKELFYIKRNNVKKYIILDDDKSLFPCPDNVNLYCPNYLTGLTKKNLKNIKKILDVGFII